MSITDFPSRMVKIHTLFLDQNGSNTIRFGAAYTYIAEYSALPLGIYHFSELAMPEHASLFLKGKDCPYKFFKFLHIIKNTLSAILTKHTLLSRT